MLILNKNEFNTIFEEYKRIDIKIERTSFGLLRLPYDTFSLYNCYKFYKFSTKQMKSIIDWTFDKENVNFERILKLCTIFSDKDIIKKNITEESYDYFLLNFSSYERNDFFEDIIFEVLYFRSKDYDDQQMKKYKNKIKKLQEITYKYLDKFNFSKKDHIKNIYYYSRDNKGYIYRNYKNIIEFNDWLSKLSLEIPINEEDFKITDDIEEYLWKKEE